MRVWRHAIESATFAVLLAAGRSLPRAYLRALGAAAGALAYHLDARHRAIGRGNLRAAYPDLDSRQAGRILRRCWRHFGEVLFDTLAFPQLHRASLPEVVRIEGLEHASQAWAARRGVILFSAHYGHWELAALVQGRLGFRLNLITRPLDNPRLERMLARLRTLSGNSVVHKRRAVREMVKALRDGEGVALLIDQDARDDGVFVPFFGRLASTTPTLAALALRTGAVVLPVFCVAQGGGAYRMIYQPPIPADPTGDRSEDIRRITAACTSTIEQWVRLHPEQWLWMHRRWKSKPTGDAARTARAPRGEEEHGQASRLHGS